MIIPPVSGEPVASPWGIAVTDLLNQPVVAMLRTSTQPNFANGSLVLVPFPVAAVAYDPHGFYDAANNGLRIPVGMAGMYYLNWWCEFAANPAGDRRFVLRVDGANQYNTNFEAGATNAGAGHSNLRIFTDGQLLQIYASQDSGGGLALDKAELQLHRIGEQAV